MDFLKIGFQMVLFSKSQAKAMVPTIQNTDIFVKILNVYDKMAAGFQIAGLPDFGAFQNLDHLQTNLFLTIQNPD